MLPSHILGKGEEGDSYVKVCKKEQLRILCVKVTRLATTSLIFLCLLIINKTHTCVYVHVLAHTVIVFQNMSVFFIKFLY